jgi:hypothetical protein
VKNKTLIIVLVGLALAVVAGYFLMGKGKVSTIVDPIISAWEKEVSKQMAWMKNDPATVTFITDKAKKSGRTYDQQLRLDAEWYAEKNNVQRPTL